MSIALATFAFACDDDEADSTESTSSDGGSGSDADTTATEGGPSGDGASTACLAAAEKLADVPDSTSLRFGLAGDSVILTDPKGGLDTGDILFTKTGALLRVPKTGGAVSTFHTPTATRSLGAFYADGTNVWFLEGVIAKSQGVFRRTTSDATPTAVGSEAYDYLGSYFAGVDATSAFLVAPGSLGKFTIAKVDRTSGSASTIAEVDTTLFGNAQVANGFVWFYGAQGTGPLYKTPVSATAPSQTEVTTKTCFGGGLLVASDAFYCGGALDLNKFDESFGTGTRLLDLLSVTEKGAAPRPNAVVGSNLVVGIRTGATESGDIYLVPTTPGTTKRLVCGVGQLEQVAVDNGYAYWVEGKTNDAAIPAKKAVYRARLPQ